MFEFILIFGDKFCISSHSIYIKFRESDFVSAMLDIKNIILATNLIIYFVTLRKLSF